MYFNICDLDKNGVLHCKADFWNDPYFLYESWGHILSHILQIIYRYIACVSDTIISCKDFF